jgi:hypothetical protein
VRLNPQYHTQISRIRLEARLDDRVPAYLLSMKPCSNPSIAKAQNKVKKKNLIKNIHKHHHI